MTIPSFNLKPVPFRAHREVVRGRDCPKQSSLGARSEADFFLVIPVGFRARRWAVAQVPAESARSGKYAGGFSCNLNGGSGAEPPTVFFGLVLVVTNRSR